jgi:nucleoside-diphosphate-sugar epimerase
MTSPTLRHRKVLVTGTSGFLGRHLTARLVQDGADVVGIDRVVPAEPVPPGPGTFRFQSVDLQVGAEVQSVLHSDAFDVVYHLAAIASPRACSRDFATAFRVNVDGTYHVLEHGERAGLIVFMSSAAVYGPPIHIPISEDHPRRGTDPYAVTKILGEDLCQNYAANYGRRVTIVRNFNSFGPYQDPEYVIPGIIRQGLLRGEVEIWNSEPIRDFSFVTNTVDALVRIGAGQVTGTYNVGSGQGTPIGKLAEIIAANLSQRRSPPRPVPVRDLHKPLSGSPALVADIRRLEGLGWTEAVSMPSGIERTIDCLCQ